MKQAFVISFEKNGVSQVRLVKAENEEAARSYFESIEPNATVYGSKADDVGYAQRGCPCDEVPDGWKPVANTYPNLTAAVNAYYDSQAENFWQDLNNITAAEATDHSYYSRTATPKLYEAIKALPQEQPLPDWIKDRMLSKLQRINDKERAKKLQKLADVAALSPLESVTVNVEWKRNPTWGHNPTAEVRAFGDGYSAKLTVGKASGCGYDKESAAIATAMNGNPQILRAMYDHAERGGTFPYSVYTYAGLPYFDGGCGVSCFRNVFEAMGYKWRDVAHGKTYDVYSVERS